MTQSSDTKVISLRLSQQLSEELGAIARIENVSLSETIRAAGHHYVAFRRDDKRFQQRRKLVVQRDLELLEGLD